MTTTKVIRVADITTTPGARFVKDGAFSGQWFRDEHLFESVVHAIRTNGKVVVDLDGTAGYATSFLEEAFGGLLRRDEVWRSLEGRPLTNFLTVECMDERELVDEVAEYLRDATAAGALEGLSRCAMPGGARSAAHESIGRCGRTNAGASAAPDQVQVHAC